MDEMEKLAQWHDSRADFWRDEAIVKLPTEAAEHIAAAATIRAAMGEIERLRTALAASEAERDAARQSLVDTITASEHHRAYQRLLDVAYGERRATAALVDWLRSRGDCQSADDEIAAWLQLQKGTSNE